MPADIEKELEVIGTYKVFDIEDPQGREVPRYRTPVTLLQNLTLAMENKKPVWTPFSSDFLTFAPRITPDNVARGFVLDKNPINNEKEAGGKDLFGVEWEWVPQVGGSMVRAEKEQMLPDIREWESKIRIPDPDSFDWEGSAKDNAPFFDPDRPTVFWFQTGLFERLISFMGFEAAALALIDDDEKPYVHALFDKLCGFYEQIFHRVKKYYGAKILYFHDDWGGQRSQFFSRDTAEEMLLPYLKRLVDFVHAEGMYFDFHSCGKIEGLVPVMIEAGVDIWSGQTINDRLTVLREHAGKIKIEAGPELEFGQSYSASEIAELTEQFIAKYLPYMDDIIIFNFSGGPAVYEAVYRATRKA
jgi:hypothetical protein